MPDDQAIKLFAIIDPIAERASNIDWPMLRSLEQMVQLKHLISSDNNDQRPQQILTELHGDNQALSAYMVTPHPVTDEANELATTYLLEEWIDQAEEGAWFLGPIVGT